MRQAGQHLSRPRLILATETDLAAQRWSRSMPSAGGSSQLFHNLKRWWGVTNLWQQSKEALELWMQIPLHGVCLTQMLALRLWKSFPLLDIAPCARGHDHGRGCLASGCAFNLSTSRARGLRRQVGAFRDALPRSGISVWQVLRRVASHASPSNRSVIPLSSLATGEISVGGRRRVLNFRFF